MSTKVGHPQVRDYLDRLKIASRSLPQSSAERLRSEIAQHLAQAIPPDADESEVAAVLEKLGTPADLVAEQLAVSGRSKLAGVRRLRWRGWLVVLVVVAAIGAPVGFIVDMTTAPDLSGPGTYGWLTKWDAKHSKDTLDLSGQQTVTTLHPGHIQGFIISVTNNTAWTQTILGAAGPGFGLGTYKPPTIGVSEFNRNVNRGGYDGGLRFTPTAAIPPGQTRVVKVSWISMACFVSPGQQEGIDTVNLRVKVGWFTRNEQIPLPEIFGLRGTKASCPKGARL